jgi:transposase-like protein
MGKITFTHSQIKEILSEIAKEKDGFNTLFKLSIEALMKAEREEFKLQHQDQSNGYRKRRIFRVSNTKLIQVSRIFVRAKEHVYQWLERPLEKYYPIVYIDAVFIPVRREESVSREAFYTVYWQL